MLRPARIAVLLAFAALGAGIVVPSAAPGGTNACAGATLTPTSANSARIRAATLCLVNAERRKNGLGRLVDQRDLRSAAQRYSRDMVQRQFFDHVAPDGSTLNRRVQRTAYLRRANSWRLGENLAWNIGEQATAAAIVATWMASPAHRVQVLQPRYRDLGIGVTSGTPFPGGRPGGTYSAVFGARVRRP
jgi:uncharacterized protein YkwD